MAIATERSARCLHLCDDDVRCHHPLPEHAIQKVIAALVGRGMLGALQPESSVSLKPCAWQKPTA